MDASAPTEGAVGALRGCLLRVASAGAVLVGGAAAAAAAAL